MKSAEITNAINIAHAEQNKLPHPAVHIETVSGRIVDGIVLGHTADRVVMIENKRKVVIATESVVSISWTI